MNLLKCISDTNVYVAMTDISVLFNEVNIPTCALDTFKLLLTRLMNYI